MPQVVEAPGEPSRSAKWHQRRHRIIDLSAKIIARSGFHATSTAELCEANQLGKGALYYYIGSKESLLAAIHDRVMDEVLEGAERVVKADGSPPEKLTMLGQELLDVIGRYPDHVWVFLHEFPALTGDNATHFRARRRKYERYIEDVLVAGLESADFRPIDPSLTARAWLGMHNYTYLWMKTGGNRTSSEVSSAFADIFIRGIASPVAARRSTSKSARKHPA